MTHVLGDELENEVERKHLQDILTIFHDLDDKFDLEAVKDRIEMYDDQAILDLMQKYEYKELPGESSISRESGGMDIYIQKLKRQGFPWLHSK